MRILEEQTFHFSFLGKKVYMFSRDAMGVVVEKDGGGVCVYGTTPDFQTILCAHPTASAKEIRNAEFVVRFWDELCATVCIGGAVKIWIDFANQRIANSIGSPDFGSDAWGRDCSVPWDARLEPYFWKNAPGD